MGAFSQPATKLILAICFAYCGVAYGGQGVLFAEMVRALGLGMGAYGSAEFTPPLVGFLCLIAGGRITAITGNKPVMLAGFVFFALAAWMLTAASGPWSFALALVAAGFGYGAVELAMNAAALDLEAITGRPAMNLLHAVFSGGAIAGALGAGVLLEAGWRYQSILLVFVAASVAVFAITALGAVFPQAASHADVANPTPLRILIEMPALRVFAVFGMLGVIGEAVANNWAVIHLRSLGAAALVGGGSYALFNAAMLIGRLSNAAVVARFGSRQSLAASGLLLVVGGALLLVPGSLTAAIAGFTLTGFGVAGMIPTALSAASERAPGRAAEVTGAVMGSIYLAFSLCGPLVGWLAEWISLQSAMWIVLLSGLAILALSRRI